MIKQAKANNHEVSAVELDDGNILVFQRGRT